MNCDRQDLLGKSTVALKYYRISSEHFKKNMFPNSDKTILYLMMFLLNLVIKILYYTNFFFIFIALVDKEINNESSVNMNVSDQISFNDSVATSTPSKLKSVNFKYL